MLHLVYGFEKPVILVWQFAALYFGHIGNQVNWGSMVKFFDIRPLISGSSLELLGPRIYDLITSRIVKKLPIRYLLYIGSLILLLSKGSQYETGIIWIIDQNESRAYEGLKTSIPWCQKLKTDEKSFLSSLIECTQNSCIKWHLICAKNYLQRKWQI